MASDDVTCGLHGKTPPRFVCRHAGAGIACGWHVDGDVALCDRCATLPHEKLVDDMRIVCTICWDECRRRNQEVPAHARGAATRLTEDERSALQAHASGTLLARQEAAQARWQIDLADEAARLDDTTGTLTFGKVAADVRLVGMFATRTDHFQWAWVTLGEAHPLAIDASLLRAFGEIRAVDALAHMSWRGELERAWEMTALAGYLLGYDAAYRLPRENAYWFFLLDHFRDV